MKVIFGNFVPMACLAFPIILLGQTGDSGSGHCTHNIDSLIAEDTSTEAGKRTSTTKLVMVEREGPRTAKLTATMSGQKKDNCPHWSGVKAPDGAVTASWIDNVDDETIVVTACEGSREIKVSTVQHFKIQADLSKFHEHVKWTENILNGFFVQNHVPSKISFGGNIAGTLENVDKYNDGSSLGAKLDLLANYSGSLGEIKLSTKDIPLPPPASLCYWRAEITFDGVKGTIGGIAVFNQSKENPWEKLESEIKLSSNISLGGAIGIGNGSLIALEANVVGTTSTYASGSLLNKNQSIYIKSKLGAGAIKAKGDLKFKVSTNFKIVVVSVEETVLNGFEGEQETLIYTIQ
jgi:hypothetical protein